LAAERKELDEKSPWWGEHLQRYEEVLKYVKGDEKILDIACGNGFGSDILARNTEGGIVGGDIAQEAIAECQQYWERPNLEFKVLDGTNLPFLNNHFDIVVSFETIEHTTEYRKMVQEFARVLKPTGTAFISTPNFAVNSPTGKVMNPYHTQEFTFEALKTLLEEVFPTVQIYGQEYKRYNIKDLRHHVGYITERFFLQRGVRQIPFSLQDSVMNALIGRPIYPEASDFRMVEASASVLKCTTFFAICKK
jgi:2-polyprenyl-3-methyl-5-hydroxy-6-metoxy-1,4-benzoquinol methylase